jgi:hypothetical protein
VAEVIVFPDAAAVVINYLRVELDARGPAIPVVSRVPKQRPATFVTVERQGGQRRNLVVDDAQLGIDCWGSSDSGTGDQEAHDLAQLCRGLIHAAAGTTQGGVQIYRVEEFAGPALLPDPLSDQPRAVLTVVVSVRGAAA